jgi:hypothetical protein
MKGKRKKEKESSGVGIKSGLQRKTGNKEIEIQSGATPVRSNMGPPFLLKWPRSVGLAAHSNYLDTYLGS